MVISSNDEGDDRMPPNRNPRDQQLPEQNVGIHRQVDNDSPESTRRRLDDSIGFLMFLKSALLGEPQTYRTFLKILFDMNNGEIGISECMKRVGTLLRDRPVIVNMFNVFVPQGTTMAIENGKVVIRSPNSVITVADDYTWVDNEIPFVPPVNDPETTDWQW